MKAFVITIKNNKYSEKVADRCIKSAYDFGLRVEKFYGTNKSEAWSVMKDRGLEWTWANMNTEVVYCQKTGLKMHPYRCDSLDPVIGCTMSHYSLWTRCVELNEPIVILEHDAVFINTFPHDIEFYGICGLNDPRGATRKADLWYQQSIQRKGIGVFPKPLVNTEEDKDTPDGLAGNSALIIKPWAAKKVIDKVHEVGVWPNDATICQQLFPWLEEYYPFITTAKQSLSTTTTNTSDLDNGKK